MNRMRRGTYVTVGMAAAAALLLVSSGRASAETYAYTIINPTIYPVDYKIQTFQGGVGQSESTMTLGPGESRNWLTTRDVGELSGHIDEYVVTWSAQEGRCSDYRRLAREVTDISYPTETDLSLKGC